MLILDAITWSAYVENRGWVEETEGRDDYINAQHKWAMTLMGFG